MKLMIYRKCCCPWTSTWTANCIQYCVLEVHAKQYICSIVKHCRPAHGLWGTSWVDPFVPFYVLISLYLRATVNFGDDLLPELLPEIKRTIDPDTYGIQPEELVFSHRVNANVLDLFLIWTSFSTLISFQTFWSLPVYICVMML